MSLPATEHSSLTVVFKGSNRCNARCVFCSVGEAGARTIAHQDFERIAIELEDLVRRRGLSRLGFTFHGGEPTLLGVEFLSRACERIARLPAEIQFSMQSNLLWRSQELVELIQRHRIQLGTSVDPLSGERRTPDGEDAFPVWLENYLALAERGLTPGAIFVVTRAALTQAERLYRIAEALGTAAGRPFGLQVNPVYPQGRAAEDPERLILPREFGAFLVELFEIWEASGRRVALTPIQQLAECFPRTGLPRNLSCTFGRSCAGTHLGIDFDLNVAGCGRRLDSAAGFGSLRDQPLWKLLEQSEEQRQIASRTETLAEGACAGCEHFELCHGGCPDDAWLATGSVAEPFQWCEAYGALFRALQARLGVATDQARPAPRSPAVGGPRVTVRAVATAAAVIADDGGAGTVDVWLLPDEASGALGFDSPLGAPRGAGPRRLRLWVKNAERRTLLLFEDLLRQRGVSVVLFELEGLEETLNVLNALGGQVELDLVHLLRQPGAEAVLDRLLRRFISDPLWKVQILPLSAILAQAMRGQPVAYTTRWGTQPGRFRLAPVAGLLGHEGQRIVDEARAESEQTRAAWLLLRRACLECRVRDVCGGRLAPGDGGACHPWSLSTVERLLAVAREVRETWESESSE